LGRVSYVLYRILSVFECILTYFDGYSCVFRRKTRGFGCSLRVFSCILDDSEWILPYFSVKLEVSASQGPPLWVAKGVQGGSDAEKCSKRPYLTIK